MCDIPTTDAFLIPRHEDVCQLALGFSIQGGPHGTRRLVTETRVFCVTNRVKRRFTPYWFLMCPVSGLIRRRMFTAIREQPESPPSRHPRSALP
ncbi:hypothetical protein AA23498_1096 [Acetobacter nitrogenifigens DSM 23921 = NBRC 105050]|uniref:DUF2867 domain-containing protein n=1 Tax=Acetobacter nitrogenifigens DSM 23921 = NBRC 105050 TaxID=1120919 RepID=A0A511XAI9_9PROT|nr:hypothetical protein AA23498_1096 [Acetobacter nitrogenifigens DSM 23921 = NBRC 105050]GEN59977.1 hypothetical protein ANI02nite_18610 [Acetobacter nitrogenifigens DSM 23921 = NBRC 105050]